MSASAELAELIKTNMSARAEALAKSEADVTLWVKSAKNAVSAADGVWEHIGEISSGKFTKIRAAAETLAREIEAADAFANYTTSSGQPQKCISALYVAEKQSAKWAKIAMSAKQIARKELEYATAYAAKLASLRRDADELAKAAAELAERKLTIDSSATLAIDHIKHGLVAAGTLPPARASNFQA